MLVYVNSFDCIGENSFFDVSRSVTGWIKKVSGLHLSIDEIFSRNNFNVGRSYVRTYTADKFDSKTYSIMYTHPDKNVSGRQWITEIGISKEAHATFISILLEISDVSTMVDSRPIATRPSLVSFLKRNCTFDHDVIGQNVLFVKNDYGDYQYLMHEIYRDDRNYPLVFISSKNGTFPTSAVKLQEQLLGLAQVVSTEGDIDSWEMERLLGRRYSSWDGAINIIYPVNTSGDAGTRLILPDQIETVLSKGIPINNHILSIISHGTNGFKKKKHISPVITRAKRLADDNKEFKERIKNSQSNSDSEELLNEALKELDEMKLSYDEKELFYLEQVEIAENSLDEESKKNIYLESEISRLKFERNSLSSNAQTKNVDIDIDKLIPLVSNRLTPVSVLSILEILLPSNVVVLKSAYTSARNSSGFKHGQRLLFLLYKLSTEYLSAFLEGGDNEAKSILGAAYSANESESVERSKQLSEMRIFEYEGNKIKMFKHVRIGVAHNKADTIRAYFDIDLENKKVVIGYCGEHLPVQST
ncbi:hypothetical protein [Dickeya oryzae]|uniref:Uncharacterized protein n=1 Tax=Dickeya oryzae TaxID=1240404 RepID=A0AB39IGR2_9GAMM|nr:hypothetical protein [Dickeya oryzae]MBP2850798.1 hypothetical protein [Dickeya oryzae]MCA6995731.1 hypothetical protein [Dickeya oryzae]